MSHLKYGLDHVSSRRMTPGSARAFAQIPLALLLASPAFYAQAELYFNPRFLADDPAAVADLSGFEKGQELPPGTISQPPFLLNTRNRTLEKNGQRIKLTQVEYSIMRMFMENTGKALSREEILDLVWGRDYFGELKIVDVNVRRLRLKIEDNATNPTYITTVWGFGYKWGF